MKIMVISILVFISENAVSTTIVIKKTKYAIYVAADTRNYATTVHGKRITHSFQKINKIHNIGNIYFAISGHDNVALLNNAIRSARNNTDIQSSIYSFGKNMTSAYKLSMATERKINRGSFNMYLEKGILAGVSFFGFENGAPVVQWIDFYISLKPNGEIDIKSVVKTAITGPPVYLGYWCHLNNPTSEEKKALRKVRNQPELSVKELVKIEAKYHLDFVAEPVDILKLTNYKAFWYN